MTILGSLKAVLVGGALMLGCSDDDPPPQCPREQPAFRLQLTAEMGTLPPTTKLTVSYQGAQMETYELSAPPAANQDVCCRPGDRVDGALPRVSCGESGVFDGGAPEALLCELWTNGVAEVNVTALGSGYPELQEMLQTELREDGCGLETVEERLVLQRPDGAVVP